MSIQFQGVNIAITNGKVERSLSAASQAPPNGLLQSVGFNTSTSSRSGRCHLSGTSILPVHFL